MILARDILLGGASCHICWCFPNALMQSEFDFSGPGATSYVWYILDLAGIVRIKLGPSCSTPLAFMVLVPEIFWSFVLHS